MIYTFKKPVKDIDGTEVDAIDLIEPKTPFTQAQKIAQANLMNLLATASTSAQMTMLKGIDIDSDMIESAKDAKSEQDQEEVTVEMAENTLQLCSSVPDFYSEIISKLDALRKSQSDILSYNDKKLTDGVYNSIPVKELALIGVFYTLNFLMS